MASQEPIKDLLKIGLDMEYAKCSICLEIWHDVVTVAPCLHNFCNGCFSKWLRNSQEKRLDVVCPQCRTIAQFVGRNPFLQKIEEDIKQAHPSLRRCDKEIALLESHALVKPNIRVVQEQPSRSSVSTLVERELARLNRVVQAQAARILELHESSYVALTRLRDLIQLEISQNLRYEEFRAATAAQFQQMKAKMVRIMAEQLGSSSLPQPPPASNLPHDAV